MHYVSLIVEFLRGRPRVVFWTASLTQAALWTLVPSLFYSAPPGDVPILLAVGREFVLGSYLGPPLAFWIGEIAFRLGGTFGLYTLAQACVVLTYWAVFTLGRAVVGTRHAVLAVLLMVGVTVFTVPSPAFGPAVLAAPLWALALLFYWRAVGENRRGYWFLLGLDLGVLLLASYVGLILVALLVVFTLVMPRARRALLSPEPWLAIPLAIIVLFPHLVWLRRAHELVVAGIRDSVVAAGVLSPGLWLVGILVLSHLGLLLLVALASGWPRPRLRRERPPEIDRNPVEPFARAYVYLFALAPALVAVLLTFAVGRLGPLEMPAPLLVLSGLAVIVAAGDQVLLYRERLVSSAWIGLLVAPPVLVVFGLAVLPWIAPVDPKVALPIVREAAFFADTYQRRIGMPLPYVSGDPRLAPLIAMAAPSRPHVYFAWAPDYSPWTSAEEMRSKGGLLVWPAAEKTNAAPPSLQKQFPELVPEVPRSFARSVQGFLPLIRVGWAMLRPEQKSSQLQ